MDIRALTPEYAVSPQIAPTDLPAIKAAGYTTVINNRPCAEIPPSHQNDAMQKAALAAGLDFVTLPVTHATLSPELAARQARACAEADGPVLAYCASGTRSTIVWAMGQAMDPDAAHDAVDVIERAARHGYDLSPLRLQLDALAAARD